MKIPKLAFIAWCACAAMAVRAQEPPPAVPAVPEADSGLKIRGLTFLIDTPITEIYAHDPSAPIPVPGIKFNVKTYLNHELSLLPVKGDTVIFTKTPDPASIKDSANILARVKMPANLKKGIFIFLPGTAKPGDPSYRVLVVDDSLRLFPRGSVKVMNLSPLAVRIVLEKEVYEFKSGETKLIEKPPVGESNSSAMTAHCLKGTEWQRFGAGVWPHPGDKRVIQIIFENSQSKEVQLVGIRDVAVRDN